MSLQEVLETTRNAVSRGISVLPIPPDGTKCPTGKWQQYQLKRATYPQLEQWLKSVPGSGICFICGPVSNYLEMLDFDNYQIYCQFKEKAISQGLGELVARIETGYLEYTPKPGVHWFYYTPGIDEGNTKLARRQKVDEETGELIFLTSKDGKQLKDIEVLIETRGKGGLGVVAPSNGRVHNSGKPYKLISGSVETITTLTSEERTALFDLAKTFDTLAKKESMPRKVREKSTEYHEGGKSAKGDRPGDLFNALVKWDELLKHYGWNYAFEVFEYCPDTEWACNYQTDNDCKGHYVKHWTRPGKDIGTSATTNFYGSDKFYVYTTSTALDSAL